MTEITSHTNSHFKIWKSLLTSKGIKNEGLFLLAGDKLIREFVKMPRFEICAELVSGRGESLTQAPLQYRLSSELFRELDELGTHSSLLVVKAPALPTWNSETVSSGLEIFCPLGDPQNLGAALRSAEAFGAAKVILLEEAAHPFLMRTIKASAGSSLRVPLERGPKLSELEGEFFALDLKGENLASFDWKKSSRLLIGEEGPGLSSVSKRAMLHKVSIPTTGVESLNAGAALSIALFHYRSQHPLK